jgi:predicted transcriptional regulator
LTLTVFNFGYNDYLRNAIFPEQPEVFHESALSLHLRFFCFCGRNPFFSGSFDLVPDANCHAWQELTTKNFVDNYEKIRNHHSNMPKPKLKQPTDAELSILRILWRRGPSSVREVLEELGPETGYTTALKFLQIMHEKGFVKREELGRSHVYSPVEPAERTQKSLVKEFLEKVFEGSTKTLVMQALSVEKASPEELLEIKKLIEIMEKKGAK